MKPSINIYLPPKDTLPPERPKIRLDIKNFCKDRLSVPQKFTFFSSLPTEIRLHIWRYAQPGPRVLVITRARGDYRKGLRGFQDINAHPSLLAVNREARHETLKSYAIIHGKEGFSLAFNSRRDIIRDRITDCWGRTLLPWLFEDLPELERLIVSNRSLRIRSIAIDEYTVQSMGKRRSGLQDWVDLDEIFIVLSPSSGLQFPHDPFTTMNEIRVLKPEVKVEPKQGWGNTDVLNTFMRGLKNARRASAPMYGPVFDKEGHFRIPTVSVVQWSWLDPRRRDPFCVPITPLSLRKESGQS